MPITKAAKKASNRSIKLHQRNSEFKLRLKMAIKKFKKSLERWEKVSPEDLNKIYKYVDKCVKVWVIKKKNGSRKKSNMAKLFSTTQNK
jgi:ribosomal protein S20